MPEDNAYQEALILIEIARNAKSKNLSLSGLGLTKLPSEIWKLKSLKTLSLSDNKLSSLPPEIGQLTNLTKLYLRNNKLRALPSELGQLIKLNKLILGDVWGGNMLNEFPLEIIRLNRLTEIYLDNNSLRSLPPDIGRLVNLKLLYLENNLLDELPPELGKLINLRELNLRNNRLSVLPPDVGKLSNLKMLDLKNNPDLSIPLEIVEKVYNPAAILAAYFDTRRPLFEAKVILVGQGSVGKTSLVQQILQGTFNENQSKTEGISQIKWQVHPIGNENTYPINANIWDFGGQEIMHATHQFFLTKRSLYLLVLDARLGQDENRIEYWLRIIQSFGGDSPVIVVGNKIDQQLLDIDRRGLQAKYSNIKAFVETSCLDGRGIQELHKVLFQEISALPHVHDELPESWFQVKEKLEKLEADFIPYSEYEALCNEGGITDEASQATLIGFLHDLGSVLNFRDDPRLQETNILNPEWVTNGVYRILNSNELFQKKGVLETKQLGQMLDRKAYPKSRHMFIVDMMRKFELCYPFEGDDGKYLVPDLLPREEPFTGDWADALAFELHYSVLPGSIISRFIVRMHPFIHQHTVWRAGVVLKSGVNLALVKADYEDKKIFIRVTGERETRRDALSMVRGTLDAIHKTITGLDAAPKVPHPDYPELVLDYDELIEFEKQGIDSFPKKVGPQVVTVGVKQLLDGVEGGSIPQVFISYAHKDKAFVNKLAKSMADEGIRIWKDDRSLEGGAAWLQEIATGISQCKVVVNVLSTASLESDSVEKELAYATYNAKKKIIPVRIKNIQPPLILVNVQYVDFYRKNYEKTFEDLLDLIRDNL